MNHEVLTQFNPDRSRILDLTHHGTVSLQSTETITVLTGYLPNQQLRVSYGPEAAEFQHLSVEENQTKYVLRLWISV